MIKLVAYDLDNTLVDMAHSHYISLNKALKEIAKYEIPPEEHQTIYNGLPTKIKLELLVKSKKIKQKHCDLIWKVKQNYTETAILETLKIDWDKIKLHQTLLNRGIKICCVTNSIRKTAELALKQTGQLEYMDFIITNEDIGKKPKPDPAGYILATYQANVLSNETLIVEDSEVGLKAAVASNCHVLVVKNPIEVNFKRILDHIWNINNGVIQDIKQNQ